MTLKAGTFVGSFEIIAPLGAGGMGEVYRARDPRLERQVALKILSPDLASSAEHLRRFEQEARAASALNHPNIISIFDVGRADSLAYIAMELVEGRDLRSMTADGPLPLKQVLRIACKVADGLAAAHERGIVHRDLKPENIMISSDGYVKICDFGLAKLIRPWGADEPTVPHTMPGAIFGTAGYMAPEQASGKATDFRSDQFSLAVILYELIASQRPFERPTPPETMTAIIREHPLPLSSIVPAVPPELERIVMRCLEKEPNERYGSTRDLARDLREVRDTLSEGASGRRSTPPRAMMARRVSVQASLVVAALILGGISYVAWRNSHSPATQRTVRSLAVLPFRDLSGTSDGQVFADGITETISTRLIRSSTMRVAAVPAAASSGTPHDIAERHDADLLLRGSVQREGSRVRVSYSIVDPIGGSDVAADTVTGSAADVFALEDLVADRVLQALRVQRTADAKPVAPSGLTGAADQTTYLEAVGLLARSKDKASVEQAIGKLRSLLANARDSAMVNGTLSRALLNEYQITKSKPFLEEAALYAERALQIDSSVAEAHIALGNVRRATGRLDEAIQSFNSAIGIQPRSADAYLGLAQALDAKGRAADAEQAFRKTLELRPDWVLAHNIYGSFCFRRGQYQTAAASFRRVIALDPKGARGYANLGAALQSMGQYDQALPILEKGLQIEPNWTAYSNVGTIHFVFGRYAQAIAAYENAVKLSPNDFTLWANLGDAYRWGSRREDAAAAYQKAIAAARARLGVDSRDATAIACVAGCLAKEGDLENAAREIRTALEINPTNSIALYVAGLTAHLKGDEDGAMLWLRRAVESGYPSTDLARDPEMAALRSRAEFAQLVGRPKQGT